MTDLCVVVPIGKAFRAGRVEEAARLLYEAVNAGTYSNRWESCGPKGKWRNAADRLLAAIEDGVV